jgi:hypothetical protein
MTPAPVTVDQRRTRGGAGVDGTAAVTQISALPVVDGHGRALGLVRIHDIYLGTR